MKKCIIWGIGSEYDQYYNQIQYQIILKNITIEAFVSRDQYCNTLDESKIIQPEAIRGLEIDYVIICNSFRFQEIKNQAIELGIEEKRIIDVKLFVIPGFDFERYTSLIENPVSIIADDCWGAEAYHYLQLPFSSPFILCYMIADDYMRILENFDYYMERPVECFQDADIASGINPIGYIGDKNPIKIYFNHATCFSSAKEDWNRRKERMNKDNIFIKMTILNEEMAERFQALPFQNKVGFYLKESKWKDIYYLPEWRWNDAYMRRYHGYSYLDYVRNSVRQGKTKDYDLLKMLSGTKDFMRKS